MKRISGISVCAGLVMGPLHPLTHEVNTRSQTVQNPEQELQQYQQAVEQAKSQLSQLEQAAKGVQKDLLTFQRMMLEDASVHQQVEHRLNQGESAAQAVQEVGQAYASMIEHLPDEYLSQRWVDVVDVCHRVVKILQGEDCSAPQLQQPCILVAQRIFPSDLIGIDTSKVLGIATSEGSMQSHAAILARGMGIATVIQLGADLIRNHPGGMVILDGFNGELLVNPDRDAVRLAQRRIVSQTMMQSRMDAVRQLPCKTRSGREFTLLASCESPEEIQVAVAQGAHGIGLLSSQSLSVVGRIPSEDAQVAYYKNCLQAAQGRPVTVCTWDFGKDTTGEPMALQGARYQLAHPEILLTQLRALWRASVYGSLRVIVPFVTDARDWQRVCTLSQQAAHQLRREGVPIGKTLPMGVLIQVPSAALMAQEILDDACGFVCIGVESLVQYTHAASRIDLRMSHYFTGWSDAVDKLVDWVVKTAHQRRIPLYLGEIHTTAPQSVQRCMEKGVTSFSVPPTALVALKTHLVDET